MADDSVLTGQTFSATVGLLYVFNLIVGTGALALPRAFQTAGYLLGLILLLVSAFTSYVCATFVLESMAIANCVLRKAPPREQLHEGSIVVEEDVPSSADGEMSEVRVGSVVVVTDGATQHRFSFPSAMPGSDQQQLAHQFIADRHQQPINSDYDISMRVEISEMAHLFLGQSGTVFSYLVLTVYLFGDLAVTSPQIVLDALCFSECLFCRDQFEHSILMGMTRTKWLQLATTLSRWTAFLLMIVLATIQLIHNGPKGSPEPANLHGFGSLFGVAVYAFMCHHSIPGLITPIRNKDNLSAKLTSVYALVYLFYCAISMTGSFTFENVQDIYTINFLHDDQTGGLLKLIDYFLALFPVFVLTSSYVIVAITLCNNIRVLGTLLDRCKRVGGVDRMLNRANTSAVGEEREALLGDFPNTPHQMDNNSSHLPHFSPLATLSLPHSLLYKFKHFGIPFLVVALPALISFVTDNVLLLASITGSFPGVGVQFVLPAFLILGARRTLSARLGGLSSVPVHLRSPFVHWLWPVAILAWACFCELPNVPETLMARR
uniref:Aa_trans domain-containing protein n=1 Tax=Globodera pallida TaxID=36090 RepID=A0A183C4B4_GLOPA